MDFPFSFGPKSSLLLIFFFHGMVFSILSFRNGIIHQNQSSKWLGLLLFLYSMYITPYMLGYAGWYANKTTREILFFIPFMQVLLIGPVVYFYSQSLFDKSFRISKKRWLHFIPALLYAIYSLVVFITDKLILDDYYFYADGRDKDLANWYQVAGLVSMICYLILSLRYYNDYKSIIFQKVSYAESILFRWIRNFMMAFLAILILRIIFFITNPEWGEFGSQFWHYIAFSFVFYYISINGYTNALKTSVLSDINFHATPIFKEKEEEIGSLISTEIDVQPWKKKLSAVIEEDKLYENPRLTLSDVAEALNTNTKVISSVVNSGFEMNFNDFINYHRIEAVKKKLADGEHQNTTLLGIALECGFNSKATFNRAFKKNTSLSPKDYLQKVS
ncbi:helix-turn-helix domain-containing protein [Flagellimonas sp.]|uniref:helix-turn-helix domain-containing protein n=1 Tax=Flagellimonas sp. TaxID=2058762 RepID=UPI003F49F064